MVEVGMRAKFFHPRTMGVMYWGTVINVLPSGMVQVKFDVDGRTFTTHSDYIN